MEQITQQLRPMVTPLINWYQQNKVLLPWREGRDPYRIWISEIMLQQTRIEAVIPYYHRFLTEIPDVETLANIPDDRLMKLWEGLGYYSRARNLKRAAQTIMSEYDGTIPTEAPTLRKLTGIGDYTAGAIASIAFGKPEPAVDGNVLRVGMRLLGRYDDIALPATKKLMTEWLRTIYPEGEAAGNLTEGIMELGERICIPNGEPLCNNCPLAHFCEAKKQNLTDILPVKSPKKARKEEYYTILLFHSSKGFALQKRPKSGLLAGLWEYPSMVGYQEEQQVKLFAETLGLAPTNILPCGNASHIFTHVTWNMQGYLIECENAITDFTWKPAELISEEYAIPTAFRFYQKITEKATKRLLS